MSRIRVAHEFADEVKKALVEHFESTKREPDDKFHVSDLLAPRFAYFQIKNGRRIRPEDVDMFIPGIAFHELLQKAMGAQYAEKKVAIEDIVGHIDLLKTYVVEIKTSRKYTIPDMPDVHYLKQCQYYMVLSGVLKGYIVVIYFTAGRNPWKQKTSTLEIVAWHVEIDEEEANSLYNEMLDTRDLIASAVANKLPTGLPLCEQWRCGQSYKGEVTRLCPYYEECKPQDRFPQSTLLKVLK